MGTQKCCRSVFLWAASENMAAPLKIQVVLSTERVADAESRYCMRCRKTIASEKKLYEYTVVLYIQTRMRTVNVYFDRITCTRVQYARFN